MKNLFAFLLLYCLFSCNSNDIKVPASPYPISNDSYLLDTIAEGFTIPYGIAIVAENEYFITDRIGKMFHFKDDHPTEIEGMPEVATFGTPGIPAIMHGGLMDVFGLEHGPQGGDEFNIIEKGKNYGSPLFSYGINYDGALASTVSEDSAAQFTVFPERKETKKDKPKEIKKPQPKKKKIDEFTAFLDVLMHGIDRIPAYTEIIVLALDSRKSKGWFVKGIK